MRKLVFALLLFALFAAKASAMTPAYTFSVWDDFTNLDSGSTVHLSPLPNFIAILKNLR
jgi:hypothetical protein